MLVVQEEVGVGPLAQGCLLQPGLGPLEPSGCGGNTQGRYTDSVWLAQLGKLPRSNMAYPHVLIPKLMARIPMMFSMKPAFTCGERIVTFNVQ